MVDDVFVIVFFLVVGVVDAITRRGQNAGSSSERAKFGVFDAVRVSQEHS